MLEESRKELQGSSAKITKLQKQVIMKAPLVLMPRWRLYDMNLLHATATARSI